MAKSIPSPNLMKSLAAHLLPTALLLLPATALSGPSLQFYADASATFSSHDTGPSWLNGGVGRFTAPEDEEASLEILPSMELFLTEGLDYDVFLFAQARLTGYSAHMEGDMLALTEIYGESTLPLSLLAPLDDVHALRLKAGVFLPSSSMENIDPHWQSPYTITWSSLNSWLAEEVRLTGLEAAIRYVINPDLELDFGATGFIGNDTAGTLLAWRGWAMGNRISGISEDLPLPPIRELDVGGMFADQRDAGTRPIGRDLDNDIGWLAHAALLSGTYGRIQASSYDNRGDRGLHGGQYAWRTRYESVGFNLQSLIPDVVIAAEYMSGDTGMGPQSGPHVQLDFENWYVLLARHFADALLSVRYENFSTRDRDKSIAPINAGPNDETGAALTMAIRYQRTERLQLAAEWIHLQIDREQELVDGAESGRDGRQFQLQARYSF